MLAMSNETFYLIFKHCGPHKKNVDIRQSNSSFCLLSGHCLQCYQCGTYVKERPVLLGSTENHDLYDPPVPKCNHFNASLPIFWVTCQPHEKGCLKGWLTQVSFNNNTNLFRSTLFENQRKSLIQYIAINSTFTFRVDKS